MNDSFLYKIHAYTPYTQPVQMSLHTEDSATENWLYRHQEKKKGRKGHRLKRNLNTHTNDGVYGV